MTFYGNQFGITANKGSLTLGTNQNVISGVLAAAEVGTNYAGQPVKLADVASPIPQFLAAGVNDDIYGFITFNQKDQSFTGGSRIEVATKDCFMIMEASAAIAAGARVEHVVSGTKVRTWAGTNTIVGKAMTKAAQNGDLIIVHILTPVLNEALTMEALLALLGTGTAGQSVVMNSGATALEFVTLDMSDISDLDDLSLLDLADGPATLGTAGQSLVMNSGADGTEFVDLIMADVTDLEDLTLYDLDGCPAAIGTAGQVLKVNGGATALEFSADLTE